MEELEGWVAEIAGDFPVSEVFIGYHKDMIPGILWALGKGEEDENELDADTKARDCRRKLMRIITLDGYVRTDKVQSDPDLTAPDLAAPRFNGRINFPQKFFEIFRFSNFLISHDM